MTIAVTFLVATILLTALGQLLIKRGALGMREGERLWRAALRCHWLQGGFLCALIAPVGYMLALRDLPLSAAFPAMSATYILVAAGASAIFRERMGMGAWAGVLLIVAGLTLIGLDSK